MVNSSTPAVSTPPKLLDQVRDKIRLKHYSIRTETQYIQWIKRFIYFHGKQHPRDLGPAEVEAFLSHLATEGNVSASTHQQTLKRAIKQADTTSAPCRNCRDTRTYPTQ